MASQWGQDRRMKKKAGFLKDNLDSPLLNDHLLAKNVISKTEHTDIRDQFTSHGTSEGNRRLVRYLLRKTEREIDDFLKVVAELQPEVALEVDPDLVRKLQAEQARSRARTDPDETVPFLTQETVIPPGAVPDGESARKYETPRLRSSPSLPSAAKMDLDRPVAAAKKVSRELVEPSYLKREDALTSDCIDELAKGLAKKQKYTRLGRRLGLSSDDLDLATNQDRNDTDYLRASSVIEYWLGKDTKDRTVGVFARALHDIDLSSLAARVFGESAKKKP